MNKTVTFLFLIGLPFVVTVFERLLKYIFILLLQTDLRFIRYLITCFMIIAFILIIKKTYGLKIPPQYKGITLLLLGLLPVSSLILWQTLQQTDFSACWINIILIWTAIVFREEFILRGYIQEKARNILKGRFLHIPNPIWFTSVLFALWHLVNIPFFGWYAVLVQLISAFFLGGPILGLIREKTGSTLISFLVHIEADFFFYSLYFFIFSKLLFIPFR